MTTINRLANGVTYICEERTGLDIVEMQVHINQGSSSEADDEAGLTYLTQEACTGGTATRTRAQIAGDIESKGASFSTNASRSATVFAAHALARDAGPVFGVLSDLIRNPAFDADEVRKTQAQIVQQIQQVNQNPNNRKAAHFMQALFGSQTIAHSPLGDEKLVASFTPAQLRARHAALLADPSQIVVSFAGRIDDAAARALVARHFGDLPPAAIPTPAPAPVTFTGGDIREPANTDQLTLSIGFPASPILDPRYYSFIMLDQLLSGGMSSPLFQEIREKRGLVYSVGSNYFHPSDEIGVFSISAGTGRGNALELLNATIELLGDFVRNEISQDELDRARNSIIRRSQSRLESTGASCGRNLSHFLTHGRVVPLEELNDRLSQVTSDSVRHACLQMLASGQYAFAGVGPQDTMPTEAEIHAKIQAQTVSPPVLRPAAITSSLSTAAPAFAAAKANIALSAQAPRMTTLPNGLRVMTQTRPGSLSMGAWTGVGADCETEAQNGASHMIEHMMFKGTKSYAPGEIDSIIEMKLLGGLNAYTGKDRTAYYFYHMAAGDIEKITDICGEMVFDATISEQEYAGRTLTLPDGGTAREKGERDVVEEEIKMYNDQINARLFKLLEATAWQGQPHGRAILGTEQSLRAMDSKALRDYRDSFYVPNNVIFCAVGQVDHDDFVDLIRTKFGHLQPRPVMAPPPQAYTGGTAHVEMDSARLCQIALGAEGVSQTDPDYYAYELFCDILGSGASSRLSTRLVDELELTNGVSAFLIGARNCGMVGVSTSASADKVRPLLNAIYAELRNAAANVTQDELDKALVRNEVAIESRTETNRNACNAFATDTLVHGAPQQAADIIANMRKVTVADIKRVAARILAGNPTMTMVVPPGTDPKLLPDHAEVLAMRDGTAKAPPAPGPAGPSVSP